MEREFVAQNVRNRLHEAEAAIEVALRKSAELSAELYAARAELGLAATVASDEMSRVAAASAALESARCELVATHHGLEVLGRALKLRTRAGILKPTQSRVATESTLIRGAA